jgi:hypothetical protein
VIIAVLVVVRVGLCEDHSMGVGMVFIGVTHAALV